MRGEIVEQVQVIREAVKEEIKNYCEREEQLRALQGMSEVFFFDGESGTGVFEMLGNLTELRVLSLEEPKLNLKRLWKKFEVDGIKFYFPFYLSKEPPKEFWEVIKAGLRDLKRSCENLTNRIQLSVSGYLELLGKVGDLNAFFVKAPYIRVVRDRGSVVCEMEVTTSLIRSLEKSSCELETLENILESLVRKDVDELSRSGLEFYLREISSKRPIFLCSEVVPCLEEKSLECLREKVYELSKKRLTGFRRVFLRFVKSLAKKSEL